MILNEPQNAANTSTIQQNDTSKCINVFKNSLSLDQRCIKAGTIAKANFSLSITNDNTTVINKVSINIDEEVISQHTSIINNISMEVDDQENYRSIIGNANNKRILNIGGETQISKYLFIISIHFT